MTAALYQLTATAAQICLPVPVAASAPDGWLDLVDHWQTLIGATSRSCSARSRRWSAKCVRARNVSLRSVTCPTVTH